MLLRDDDAAAADDDHDGDDGDDHDVDGDANDVSRCSGHWLSTQDCAGCISESILPINLREALNPRSCALGVRTKTKTSECNLREGRLDRVSLRCLLWFPS